MERAYCTLVTSDGYVGGAITLRHSLQTHLNVICMVTPDTLSQHALLLLQQHFTTVICVPLIRSLNTSNLALLGRPELDITLTKINVWNTNLIKYKKVVFMDADTLAIKNIDSLFTYLDNALFAAAPGNYIITLSHSNIINSNLLL